MFLSPFYQWRNWGSEKWDQGSSPWDRKLLGTDSYLGLTPTVLMSCPFWGLSLGSARVFLFSPVGLPSSSGPTTQYVCFVFYCPMCPSLTFSPIPNLTGSDLAHFDQTYRILEFFFASFRERIISGSPKLLGQLSDMSSCFGSRQVVLLNFTISPLPTSHLEKGVSRSVCSASALLREDRTRSTYTWSHLLCPAQQAFMERSFSARTSSRLHGGPPQPS